MKKINLAISGCMGRMGQQLIKSSKKNKNFKLVTLTENRLINKKIDNTELQNSFICAYAIGYIIPEIFYNNVFPNIKQSLSYNDTNCLISWSTVVEGFKRNREKTLFWMVSRLVLAV